MPKEAIDLIEDEKTKRLPIHLINIPVIKNLFLYFLFQITFQF